MLDFTVTPRYVDEGIDRGSGAVGTAGEAAMFTSSLPNYQGQSKPVSVEVKLNGHPNLLDLKYGTQYRIRIEEIVP